MGKAVSYRYGNGGIVRGRRLILLHGRPAPGPLLEALQQDPGACPTPRLKVIYQEYRPTPYGSGNDLNLGLDLAGGDGHPWHAVRGRDEEGHPHADDVPGKVRLRVRVKVRLRLRVKVRVRVRHPHADDVPGARVTK
eukprot:scaffold72701_cov51-Phaeocystis_antarctica.AAC.1